VLNTVDPQPDIEAHRNGTAVNHSSRGGDLAPGRAGHRRVHAQRLVQTGSQVYTGVKRGSDSNFLGRGKDAADFLTCFLVDVGIPAEIEKQGREGGG